MDLNQLEAIEAVRELILGPKQNEAKEQLEAYESRLNEALRKLEERLDEKLENWKNEVRQETEVLREEVDACKLRIDTEVVNRETERRALRELIDGQERSISERFTEAGESRRRLEDRLEQRLDQGTSAVRDELSEARLTLQEVIDSSCEELRSQMISRSTLTAFLNHIDSPPENREDEVVSEAIDESHPNTDRQEVFAPDEEEVALPG